MFIKSNTFIKSNWRFVIPLFLFILPPAAVYGQNFAILAEALPDECWNGCGQPYIPIPETGICPAGTIPKRNQAYVWALTKRQQDIWLGTGPNISILAQTAGTPVEDCAFEGSPDNPSNVIEGALSQYPGVPEPLRPFLGDWRPPEAWLYNLANNSQTDVTPNDPLIRITLGLRAAGAADGVVIFGGPTLIGLGVNMFAFDAETKQYLGSTIFPQYSNIRKFVTIKGELYAGVQTTDGDGAILRWDGNRDNPFAFSTVGNLDDDAANLTEHNGRIFVATWPPSTLSSSVGLFGDLILDGLIPDGLIPGERLPAGIWMSPPIPEGGLTPLDADRWTKVWEVTDYEPDEVIASTQVVGDLASFDGYLYWGTMNPPWGGLDAFVEAYGEPENPEETEQNIRRAIPIFRGNFGNDPEIELLYGERQLPRFDGNTQTWNLVNNNMGGEAPRFGTSGFGFQTNVYTWTMAVFQGELYVGTLDTSVDSVFPASPGGDLWHFLDGNSAATPFTTNGFENPETVIGVRTMVSSDEGLFVGTSSRANLLPDGGWKLIQIAP